MSDTSSPTPIDASEYGSFPPGTIVLAKLKSFPPWPAIVIPNDLVPEKILKSKPKKPSSSAGGSSGGSRRPKRKAAPVASTDLFKVWCVRFLKDDTFMWASLNELELLTTEKIQSALGGWKNIKKKQLKSAYEMALSPPDVEDFIIWGSDGKPIQIDNEADDEDFTIDDEDEEEDEDVAEEDEDVEEDLEDEDQSPQPTAANTSTNTKKRGGKALPKASASKKRKTAAAGSKKSTPVPTPKKPAKGRGSRSKTSGKGEDEEQDPDTSGDEDWEQAIGEFEEEEDLIGREIPTSSEYAELLKKNKPLINKVVIQFTTAFLEEEKLDLSAENIKSLNGLLDQLTKVQDTIPKSLVLKNHVHKLFIAVLQRNDLKAKNVLSIRTRLQQFLSYWFDFTVEVNPNWKLEPEEDEEDEEEEEKEVVEIKDGTDATHDVKEESLVVATAVEEVKTQ
ncbi:hypothetical protein WICPIJ_001528 [Wickerhamomyces pijperi]|uniref:PWWP domain-containing protein n=1 Tax=Wickerhamomyces pijperi TaxID=599730 RepID=A0A9P8QAN3_WICPI|nr:hypothetical protein WICPIJ_001528 [Wickerhamomyces pijperi]